MHPCTRSAVDRVCFRHGANESELTCGPPFGVPNLLQSNRIVSPIVDVINPMLAAVVAGEILGIIEGIPLPIFLLPVRRVIGHFGEKTVRAHHFCHKFVIPRAMNVEADAVHVLAEGLRTSERLVLEVPVDLVARDSLWPILALFDERLTVDPVVMQM